MPDTFINPAETGLYYLKSRYYDPEVGRFINSDSILSGVKGSVQGYNLYGYCLNDPVNLEDSMGTVPKSCGRMKSASWFREKQGKHLKSVSAYGNPNLIWNFLVEGIREDINNIKLLNSDPQKVLASNYISVYRGVPIIKVHMPDRSMGFSFGMIFLSEKAKEISTVNHEYGHTQQLIRLGVLDYSFFVALPSMIINIMDDRGCLPFSYYGAPFESEADKLGGVDRKNDCEPWPILLTGAYWLTRTLVTSTTPWPF